MREAGCPTGWGGGIFLLKNFKFKRTSWRRGSFLHGFTTPLRPAVSSAAGPALLLGLARATHLSISHLVIDVDCVWGVGSTRVKETNLPLSQGLYSRVESRDPDTDG